MKKITNKTEKELKNFYKNKKILVTGGCGFIGSYLVPLLLEFGAKVRIVDDLSRGKLEHLGKNKNHIEFIKTDLTVFKNCLLVCKEINVVFNLAAKNTGIEYDPGHEHEMFTENMLLQIQPLRAASIQKVPYFLQVSSAVVYPRKDGIIYEEDASGDPEPSKAGYAYAKKMGELAARWFAQNTKMKVAIARPNNAYGPKDESSITTLHVIPALINKILRGDNPVVMFGSGKQRRSFIHALDFTRGLIHILAFASSHEPQPINVASSDEFTINQIYKFICEALNENRPVVHDLSKPEGPKRRLPDNTKLKKLGWRQIVPFPKGIKETADYIKSQYKK